MARTDNLTNYLTDVADAIRTKTGSQATIQASNFDTAIEGIETIDDGFVIEGNTYTYRGTSSSSISDNKLQNYFPQLLLKKVPYFEISCDNINYGFSYLFNYCVNLEEVDLRGVDVSSNTYINYKGFFNNCYKLKEIDLSSWGTITGIGILTQFCYKCASLKRANLRCFSGVFNLTRLFDGCTSLEYMDVRGLDFANCTNFDYMLGYTDIVPTTCEIIVADTTQKEWFATNFPTYTNVKTVAEYES